MSTTHRLHAQIRTVKGKNACRKLREQGLIPAVLYTASGENLILEVKEASFAKVYRDVRRTAMFELVVTDGQKEQIHPSFVWDIEYFPTKNRFQHVDFYGVDVNKEIVIRIPLEFVGTSKGVKAGGKLETYREQIDIKGKPGALPQKLSIDLTNIDVNQGLRVADLQLPEGVVAHYTDNFAILMVNAPGGAEATEDAKK